MNRPSWIGQTLGARYRIDEIIGQGGMSTVYKAYDPNLKRVVAVKMIHPHLAEDPRFIIRFEEEAAAVAQLRHPNIVQVYDFHHDGDLYYMVQEYLVGETLQERLRRMNKGSRRMPVSEAIGYAQNISDAAGYAHKRGMVHRDIKPANIILDIQGQAILMDFGIVKIIGGQKHTATGAVVGTALYLPPEVIRGEQPDARSDLYSLGITFYEMVSGRPPFEAESAMTLMMMHLNDPLPDMRGLRPEVSDDLIAVIEKALAKDRNKRYASMAEFAAALRGTQAAAMMPSLVATQEDAFQTPIPPDKPAQSQSDANLKTGQGDFIGPALVSNLPTELESTPALQRPPEPGTNLPSAGNIPSAAVVQIAGPDMPPSNQTESGVGSSGGSIPPSSTSGSGGGAGDKSAQVSTVAPKRPSRSLLWAAAGVILFSLVTYGIVMAFNRQKSLPAASLTPFPSATTAALVVPTREPTSTQTPTPPPTETLAPTATLPPTQPPTPSPTPLPTIPAGVPYAIIKGITTNSQQAYIVDYQTFDYKESLTGKHVHFFFNTTPPDQAGNPGTGPWYVWGGPRPFPRFLQNMRPANATQICILVANEDHTVVPESGNCYIVPDVNVAAPFEDQVCLTGAGPTFPAAVQLHAGQLVIVEGLSPDEAWWNVQEPDNPNSTCWLERSQTSFQGQLSNLPMILPPPPLNGAVAANLNVEITGITLDAEGRYVVEYKTAGYTEALPGTHIHFFWDVFAGEQVGSTSIGKRIMYGGPTPFTGFSRLDRPASAAQICGLVASPEHNVIPGSGNCFDLP